MRTSDRAGPRAPRRAVAWTQVRPATWVCSCVAGLLVMGALDLLAGSRRWPVPIVGALDEPAHLITASLLLAAGLPHRGRRLAPWALAGSVLIDLDHLPFYIWGALTTGDAGRPLTHSLATAVVLTTAGLLTRRRWRTAYLGLALGVLLHLVRDLGTGPGVPLWWPLSSASVLVPYWVYFATMTVCTVVAAALPYAASVAVRSGRPSNRVEGEPG